MGLSFSNCFGWPMAAAATVVALSASITLPANAADLWKTNLQKSHFGPKSNVLVIERNFGSRADKKEGITDADAQKIVVIADGSVFIATNGSYAGAASAGRTRTIDYSRWKDMNLIKIGDRARVMDYCDFACQSGLPSVRLRLTFDSGGADVSNEMRDVAVLRK